MTVSFRWLGVAGLELTLDGQTLLIDPFFTRPRALDVFLGRRVPPQADLPARYLHNTPAASAPPVLVSHPHYDHLLDVPAVLRQLGGVAYGSPNTCRLLSAAGVPAAQRQPFQVGDHLRLGRARVSVLPAWHTHTPIDRRINGPLPRRLRPPLRLTDYRMDFNASFLIEASGQRILVGNEPVDALDALFITPFYPPPLLAELLRRAQPRRVIPIHWDHFMLPLPARGQPRPLPLRRLDLSAFRRRVQAAAPQAEVIIPTLFAATALD